MIKEINFKENKNGTMDGFIRIKNTKDKYERIYNYNNINFNNIMIVDNEIVIHGKLE